MLNDYVIYNCRQKEIYIIYFYFWFWQSLTHDARNEALVISWCVSQTKFFWLCNKYKSTLWFSRRAQRLNIWKHGVLIKPVRRLKSWRVERTSMTISLKVSTTLLHFQNSWLSNELLYVVFICCMSLFL